MLGKRIRLPGPAMIVALLALFVALSGTAVAAGIVPLAKRALVADNAKKLNGATLKQVIGGIVTAAPALVSVQTQPWSLNGGGGARHTAELRPDSLEDLPSEHLQQRRSLGDALRDLPGVVGQRHRPVRPGGRGDDSLRNDASSSVALDPAGYAWRLPGKSHSDGWPT